jgi:uncharacterized protein
MRKICLLFTFIFLPFFVYAQDIPVPIGWVNDFAGVVTAEYKDKLNSLIGELQEKTSAEIAVVTITSIAPYDEKGYARLLFDNWKPGKIGKDSGILVLLAVKERRWRIETGYGVEGILPDGLCGEIGRNYMVPYFKEGKYSEGLYYGVIAIAKVISKDSIPNINTAGMKTKEPLDPAMIVGMTILLFIFSFLFGLMPFFFGIPLFLLFALGAFSLSIISGFIVIASYILSLKVRHDYWSKLPSSERDNFFGWSGGGYSGGGGFGGGGFGGFGGGCGGGGGAGGGF